MAREADGDGAGGRRKRNPPSGVPLSLIQGTKTL